MRASGERAQKGTVQHRRVSAGLNASALVQRRFIALYRLGKVIDRVRMGAPARDLHRGINALRATVVSDIHTDNRWRYVVTSDDAPRSAARSQVVGRCDLDARHKRLLALMPEPFRAALADPPTDLATRPRICGKHRGRGDRPRPHGTWGQPPEARRDDPGPRGKDRRASDSQVTAWPLDRSHCRSVCMQHDIRLTPAPLTRRT